MQERSSRRRFVKGLGAVALVGSLAGCGGDDGDTDTPEGGNGGTTDTDTETGGNGNGNMTETDTPTDTETTATEEPGTPTPTRTPTPIPPREEYLANVPNYDGEPVDETGNDNPTVLVGDDGNLFTPPAITITTGTTVTWEWKGPNHNVVAEDGTFDSGETQGPGTTFEFTFDEPDGHAYYCEPHEGLQMKGHIEVVE